MSRIHFVKNFNLKFLTNFSNLSMSDRLFISPFHVFGVAFQRFEVRSRAALAHLSPEPLALESQNWPPEILSGGKSD